MPDLIHLLPDSVANQIAAGEVVQRPASVVKELLENAVDSGATNIKLLVRDAGKALVQVIDNGCGMSERDARMCFERHATSKIEKADDLLSIRTLGFRGEALASIASIAQVEVRTKRSGDEVGTCVQIEGTEVKSQFPVTTPEGTSIAVKNLFYNVPARRNFLKSNTLELKYIIEEFFRVALVTPSISFSFYNNDKILHQVSASNLKQRIVELFGNTFNPRLVPVEQESTIVSIRGFIGKPEFARKTRGEQYFFANGRFIKNPYLHHSIENAYKELIPEDALPTYFIYFNLDPKTIDVNIHPTKTEINFQDIKNIYAILHSSVRQAIGKFNITPSLDFEQEKGINIPPLPKGAEIRQPVITINPDYNPFEKKTRSQYDLPLPQRDKPDNDSWRKLYDPLKEMRFPATTAVSGDTITQKAIEGLDDTTLSPGNTGIFQLRNRFIITNTSQGIVIIDQQNAHERILFERLLSGMESGVSSSQQLLMPQTLKLSHEDKGILEEYRSEFEKAGFGITDFGKETILVQSVPADCPDEDYTGLFEKLLESLKSLKQDPKLQRGQRLARSLSKSLAVSRKKNLQPEEMNALVEQLFSCRIPDVTADGKPTMTIISYDELNKKFK
jgi:DNA mismatch repair protein MutL